MDTRGARKLKQFVTILLLASFLLACEFLIGEPAPDSSQVETDERVEALPTTAGLTEVEPEPQGSADETAQFDSLGNLSTPPSETAKLIFIHHSVGENWLADGDGELGLALRDNNYFVSDTNYGWGPDGIGDRTDTGDWIEWFVGPDSSDRALPELYTSFENYSGNYSRLDDPDSGRENEIILFKSCYPNSNLDGNPNDPAAPGDPNSVGGAKYVYLELLRYFETQPDKLFVVITAPPVTAGDGHSPPENARAFNNWLFSDWLADYSKNNVAVFDFYNVLTSNGGNLDQNDLGRDDGNHHRWWNGVEQHIQTEGNDLSAYGSDDSHPNRAGNLKATGEFVPLLNTFYNLWQNSRLSQSSTPISSDVTSSITPTPNKPLQSSPSELIQPDELTYIGAFRLPDGPPEIGWEWGGAALAYFPDGDPSGPKDGFPGSLFGTGHNWNQYVSEINIPKPIDSPQKNLDQLNAATTLQEFADIRGSLFEHLNFELPRAGLAYLPAQDKQHHGYLHFCWGQHYQEDGPQLSHGWSELDLSNPQPAGAWLIGDQSPYSTNDYLFPVPAAWAEANTPGMLLATGRFRDGGWGGQGPSLFVYSPRNQGNPPPSGARLETIPLLLYASTLDGQVEGVTTMNDYHHSDEWSGGAWLTAGEKAAVVFAGTKGLGEYWYGFANGVVWPDEAPFPAVPAPPNDDRGWWSSQFEGQLLFYNPDDLAAVALGHMATGDPQPYATLDIDPVLFNIQSEQQKEHTGAVAFDRERGFLYLFEPLADGDKPLVHVWQVYL